MWFKRRQKRRQPLGTKAYQMHKEDARALVLARLAHFNQHYQYTWKRVAIKNTRRSWGSCSALKNLNFNYKIIFLPPNLADYIIVHELCHLAALHHRQTFWDLVAETIPDYKERIIELRMIERGGLSLKHLRQNQNTAPD